MHLRPAAVICSCYLQSPATQLHGKDTKNECVGRKLEVKKYKNECSHSGPKEKPKQHLCSLRDATYYSVDKTTKISLNNMSHSCDCGYPVKIVFDSLAAQLTHHPLHYSCSCSAWCERSAKTVPWPKCGSASWRQIVWSHMCTFRCLWLCTFLSGIMQLIRFNAMLILLQLENMKLVLPKPNRSGTPASLAHQADPAKQCTSWKIHLAWNESFAVAQSGPVKDCQDKITLVEHLRATSCTSKLCICTKLWLLKRRWQAMCVFVWPHVLSGGPGRYKSEPRVNGLAST